MRIAIPIFPGHTPLDVVGPYEVLSRLPDAEVLLAGPRLGSIRNEIGSLALEADAIYEDVDAADVIVVPGGRGTRALLTDDRLLGWIRRMDAATEWTTSVCTGSLLLGAAGLLVNRPATTHWLELDRLREFGAEPSRDRVVRSGKLLTAAGVSAGIDMALTLASEIAGPAVAQVIQLSIEYDPHPPFNAGNPEFAPASIVDAVRRLAAHKQRVRVPSTASRD